MARKQTWGTPGRTTHYLQPRPAYSRAARAFGLGAAVAVVLLAFHLGGWKEPLMPGGLSRPHATIETCQQCHLPRTGVSNLRCQRCHDPSGAGRLVQVAHVSQIASAGRRNVRAVELAEDVACASCHVEHRGRDASLAAVPEVQCLSCHGSLRPELSGQRFQIASFSSHPEFRVLRDRLQEVPGLEFTHDRHVREVRKRLEKAGAGGAEEATCAECHQLDPRGRDYTPISFDTHCASCHAADLAVEPVAEAEVEIGSARGPFDRAGGKVTKSKVVHKDEWILANLRRMQRELFPDAYAEERGRLEARASVLRRRLALAEPLAALEPSALEDRRRGLEAEFQRLEQRIAEQQRSAAGADTSARLDEVIAAAAASGDAASAREAERLRTGPVEPPSGPLSAPDFEARRRRLLSLIDALAVAQPTLRPRADYLRVRLLSLSPGQSGPDGLRRARAQRARELARVRDEIALRGEGIALAPLPDTERRLIERSLAETEARLAPLAEAPPLAPLSPEERGRKEEALRALTGADRGERCAKCHVFREGGLVAVVAAQRVLVLSAFDHEPHVRASLPEPAVWRRFAGMLRGGSAPPPAHTTCTYCHGDVARSHSSADVHLRGVQSCRECHRTGAARQDCESCHRYHPPVSG